MQTLTCQNRPLHNVGGVKKVLAAFAPSPHTCVVRVFSDGQETIFFSSGGVMCAFSEGRGVVGIDGLLPSMRLPPGAEIEIGGRSLKGLKCSRT